MRLWMARNAPAADPETDAEMARIRVDRDQGFGVDEAEPVRLRRDKGWGRGTLRE